MNKIVPLSIREYNNKIILQNKGNKISISRRNNLSSFARRNSYNNPHLFKPIKTHSRNLNREKPKLFSLLDINDKITNSKGTSLPEQYRRLTDNENERLFGFSYGINNNYNFKNLKPNLNNKSEENIIFSYKGKNTEKKRKIKRCKSDFGDKLKLKKNNCFNEKLKLKEDKIIENNKNYDIINNNKIIIDDSNKDNEIVNSKKNPIKLIKSKQIEKPFEYIKSSDIKLNENCKENLKDKKDRWLPKGYSSYELLIKNPKLFTKKLKIEYLSKKILSAKAVQEKAFKSDIFFFEPASEKEVAYKKIDRCRDYQNSDIFNIKNDTQNISKSGETYLFKKNNALKYNISSESKSQWKISDNKFPTYNNCSSKDYNILNPDSKGLTLGKEKIIIECEKLKDKNSKMFNNVNYINPTFRQKRLTEFIDLTRNGASNTGKDYMKVYNKNKKCFYKNNGLCSLFYDTHFHYQNICKKPFIKNFFD